jgi:hypothetical protein
MSIETATQRMNTALGDFEAKVNRRLDALEAENTRVRSERDSLLAENTALKASVAATMAASSSGIDAKAHAVLQQQRNTYRGALTQTLNDIDSLISRVSNAAQ